MRFSLPLKELTWLAPFTFLSLISLAPLRPWPVFPAPAHSRVITDGQGEKVAVPLPVHIISNDGAVDYLELTHAPEALFKAGNPRQHSKFASGMWGRFYPQLARNDELWNNPGDVESRLAQDDGATYFEWNSTSSRRLGLASVMLAPKKSDDMLVALVHIENAALGREADGEAIIADYQQAYADLDQELQPETLASLPRVLPMGSSTRDWSNLWVHDTSDSLSNARRVGVRTASVGFRDTGRQQEAERILAMNPDIIFAGNIDELLHDPRWRGLKAIQSKRVYNGLWIETGVPSWRLDGRPLLARWVAEVAHPERLQPKIRELIHDHFVKAYGYRLSDGEIDNMLNVEQQKNAPGYERFFRNYHVGTNSIDGSHGAAQ